MGWDTHFQVGPNGKSVGIEHVPELVDFSTRNMQKSETGASLLSSGQVVFVVGDGRLGYSVRPTIQPRSWWSSLLIQKPKALCRCLDTKVYGFGKTNRTLQHCTVPPLAWL
jgi:hypothetical protein